MRSKEMAAYVPMVQEMADTAIAFLAEQGLCNPAAYPMPELRLSLERRVKIYGIYNKNNVLVELKRLQQGFIQEAEAFGNKELFLEAVDFMEKLALFLNGFNAKFSNMQSWLQLKQKFNLLKSMLPSKVTDDFSKSLKLWQQLIGLFAKVQQLEIKQQLSGVFSSEGRITLYMNNIEAICHRHGFNMKAYLQSVLVHEYAHACHYAAFMEARLQADEEKFALEKAMLYWSGACFGKSRVTAIKESLARYVQILWCRLNEPDLSSELENGMYGEYVIYPSWPYAGALGILSMSGCEADCLFSKIWQASLLDWELAYELLGTSVNNVK